MRAQNLLLAATHDIIAELSHSVANMQLEDALNRQAVVCACVWVCDIFFFQCELRICKGGEAESRGVERRGEEAQHMASFPEVK